MLYLADTLSKVIYGTFITGTISLKSPEVKALDEGKGENISISHDLFSFSQI